MLYKNKYRVETCRLKSHDYSGNAAYFVTICTKDMIQYFGNVNGGKMILNDFGEYTQKCWNDIPKHFPNVSLKEFVIMPNHIHGIIIQKQYNNSHANKAAFGPQSKNLASIIRGFKIGVTKYAKKNQIKFKWHPRYYDHIIRDYKSYLRICKYIRLNPLNWKRFS